MEKYISFSIGNLRFIDSLGFLPSSLEVFVDNLAGNGESFDITPFKHFQNEITEHTELLLRKGVYPYEYMDSLETFDETEISSINHFYSSLTGGTISLEDHQHAKHVFEI